MAGDQIAVWCEGPHPGRVRSWGVCPEGSEHRGAEAWARSLNGVPSHGGSRPRITRGL